MTTTGIYVAQAAGSGGVERRHAPRIPVTVDDLGLSEEFLIDLLLKTLYMQGARTGKQLIDVALPAVPVRRRAAAVLQQRRFVEVQGTRARAGPATSST